MKATQNQIERLQQKLAEEMRLNDLCRTDEKLAALMDQFDPLLHSSSTLYGSSGCLGFKANVELLKLLPELFANSVQTQQASGQWYYSGFPATDIAREIIRNKDSTVRMNMSNDCQFTYGVNDFKVSFYYKINTGEIVEIDIDYSNVIIGQRYNQFDRNIQIPHLQKNPRYNKSLRNSEPEYIGVNCNYQSNNYAICRVNSFKDLEEINKQFEI